MSMPRYTVYYNAKGYSVYDGEKGQTIERYGNCKGESTTVLPVDSPLAISLPTIRVYAWERAEELQTRAIYDPTDELFTKENA